MKLKTYQAKTMGEALAEVKRDLGRDAVILHTRRFRKGGILGLGGRRVWEIAAAPNVNVPPRPARGQYLPNAIESPANAPTDDDARQRAPGRMADHLAGQMTEIRRMMATLLARRPHGQCAEPVGLLGQYRERLAAQDVEDDIIVRLINRLRLTLTGKELDDEELVSLKLAEFVAAAIRFDDDAPKTRAERARILALIGPTGVGKTTTIAKLAARFKLQQRKRVGLITLDTYRIAAVDQLRTYADIIEVPLRVVLSAAELRQAVYALRGMDVLLIDTAGRSQNNSLRLGELRSVLGAAEPDEVHLVVSTNANRACTRRTLERFMPLGANRILLTKLDEAITFGNILNIALAGKVPLSYVTTGQEVPDDLAAADPAQLAQYVMKGAPDAD